MLEKVHPSTVGMCEDRLERVTQWLEEQVSGERLAGAHNNRMQHLHRKAQQTQTRTN